MNLANKKNKLGAEQLQSRRFIFQMIDASMQLALKKGAHSLENGCNCMACVNKRKALFTACQEPWKYKV